jgi:hypothetical protein
MVKTNKENRENIHKTEERQKKDQHAPAHYQLSVAALPILRQSEYPWHDRVRRSVFGSTTVTDRSTKEETNRRAE